MILLVDNADSYTYNLYQLISRLTDDDVAVVPASEIASPSEAASRIPDLVRAGHFSHVIISPGPGHPGQPLDFAGSQAVIEAAHGIPLLGVCLGHQGLGLTHGADVVQAPRPGTDISADYHTAARGCSRVFRKTSRWFVTIHFMW